MPFLDYDLIEQDDRINVLGLADLDALVLVAERGEEDIVSNHAGWSRAGVERRRRGRAEVNLGRINGLRQVDNPRLARRHRRQRVHRATFEALAAVFKQLCALDGELGEWVCLCRIKRRLDQRLSNRTDAIGKDDCAESDCRSRNQHGSSRAQTAREPIKNDFHAPPRPDFRTTPHFSRLICTLTRLVAAL